MEVVLQDGNSDCGVASLLSIIRYYGGDISLEKLREMTNTNKDGVSAYNLIECAKELGFSSMGVNGTIDELDISKLPVIAHVSLRRGVNHFIVIYEIDHTKDRITIMDPSCGRRVLSFSEFSLMSTNNYIYLIPIKKITNYKYYKFIKYSLYKYIINNKFKSSLILIFNIIYFIINILLAFHFKYLIKYSINYLVTKNIMIISIFVLHLYFIKTYSSIIRNILLSKWLNSFDIVITRDVLKQIIFLPYNYYKNRSVGELINRIKDLSIIKDFISNLLCFFISDLIIIVIFLVLMFNISTIMSIYVLIYFILLLIIFVFSRKIFKDKIDNIKRYSDYSNTILVETISNIMTIKNIHAEKRMFDNFILKYKKLIDYNYKFDFINYSFISMKEIINSILIVIIYGLGSLLVINNKISILELFLYEMFFNYFNTSTDRIMSILDSYHNYRVSVSRIDDLFNISRERFSDSYYYLNYKLDSDIKFSNLSYMINNRYLFNKVNLNINRGDKVLLFGDSGSGKSTLVRILMRYIDIPYNMVSINDIDINHYHLESIRSNITYISSNEYLFNDTIYNNICLSKDVSKDKFYEVVNLVFLDNICNSDYDKLIEEGGANFSSGERQRIILARSLIRNTNIYIFDEAFNAIDISKERKILNNIFNYLENRIVIVISHRFNNKDLFNKTYQLKDGNIYEV